uniref:BED-type domain-containing protein n=1 Tax=Acrobeloides nanus TaxID=290746 RepID=A0A914D3W4_9BILA
MFESASRHEDTNSGSDGEDANATTQRRHASWTYFNITKTSYTCNIKKCGKSFNIKEGKFASSTIALRHLKDKHSNEFKEVEAGEKRKKSEAKANTPKRRDEQGAEERLALHGQPTITEALGLSMAPYKNDNPK